jgi:hypothetical protein
MVVQGGPVLVRGWLGGGMRWLSMRWLGSGMVMVR